jgi:hypothetical protein
VSLQLLSSLGTAPTLDRVAVRLLTSAVSLAASPHRFEWSIIRDDYLLTSAVSLAASPQLAHLDAAADLAAFLPLLVP